MSVGNHLAGVRLLLELLGETGQLRLVQRHPVPLQAVLQGMSSGMFAQHDHIPGDAHFFRVHNFIGAAVLEQSVLVDARLMLEGVAAYDRFVVGNGQIHDPADHPGGFIDFGAVNAGEDAAVAAPGGNGHGQFLQGAVACPFTDAVDGHLHMGSSAGNGRQAVGYGKPKIIVAVGAVFHLVAAPDIGPHPPEQVAVLLRQGITHRIGNVQDRGAFGNDYFQHLIEEFIPGAGGVHRGEFNNLHKLLGIRHHVTGNLEHLLPAFFQLEVHMDLGGGNKQVQPASVGVLGGADSCVNVALDRPGEAADFGAR
ncbi:hypothetical protein D3C75_707510 [compost metagenome]